MIQGSDNQTPLKTQGLTNRMEGSTLVQLAERKLDDLTERHDYFLSRGDKESASFIADEGLMLAEALENNDTFFCLPNLGNFSS